MVGTMKGLAAVAVHDYERAVRALREYPTTIELGFPILFMAQPEAIPAELPVTGRTASIVIGTDQGLCGPLNREAAPAVREWVGEHAGEAREPIVVCLGVRTARELEAVGPPPTDQVALPGAVEAIAPLVEDLVVAMGAWRRRLGVGRVVVFFQHPIRRTQRTPRMFQVVPPGRGASRRHRDEAVADEDALDHSSRPAGAVPWAAAPGPVHRPLSGGRRGQGGRARCPFLCDAGGRAEHGRAARRAASAVSGVASGGDHRTAPRRPCRVSRRCGRHEAPPHQPATGSSIASTPR